MAITKEKKQAILAKLEEIKNEATTIVMVGFNGLSVAESTAMRSTFRETGVSYFVAKKTLIKRAFTGAFIGTMPDLDGEVALAYSDDEITPAQQVKVFEKTTAGRLSILGGVFQGAYKDKAAMTEIASIPSLPVLYGMFANFCQQPAQGLALVMQAVAEAKKNHLIAN